MEKYWITTLEPQETMIDLTTYRANHKIIYTLLSICFLLQCVGMFLQIYSGSAIQTMFFMQYEMETTDARRLELIFGYGLIILGFWVFIKPKKSLLVLMTFLMILYSWIIQSQGGSQYATWALWAHMARIVAPFCMLLFLSQNATYRVLGYYVLLLGLAITYFTHGLEALHHHPHFLDYIIRSSENIFAWKLNQFTATWILNFIGVLDIIVAISVVLWKKKGLFIWMLFWGLVTGFSRVTSMGIGMYPEVLIRAIHVGAPVLLIILTQNVPINIKTPNLSLILNKYKRNIAFKKFIFR